MPRLDLDLPEFELRLLHLLEQHFLNDGNAARAGGSLVGYAGGKNKGMVETAKATAFMGSSCPHPFRQSEAKMVV